MTLNKTAKTVVTSLLFGATLLAPLYIALSSASGGVGYEQDKMADTTKTTKRPKGKKKPTPKPTTKKG